VRPRGEKAKGSAHVRRIPSRSFAILNVDYGAAAASDPEPANVWRFIADLS
jgi:hypothetical protein